jgi:hypothetical protein
MGAAGEGSVDEGVEPERPRQARAGAFAGEAADVFVFVLRPAFHHGEGAGQVALEELADGELGELNGVKNFNASIDSSKCP